ncbi:MAG: LPXTG cell wall anchor domain-containing protein, partial [Rhodocyclales bacterium]|nr:LPXTG cell wall anchor domain-containing protein [Rhodocyclales bacterium]
TATLDTSLAAPAAAHAHDWNEWTVWGLAALLLLASGILLAVRRRKQRKSH